MWYGKYDADDSGPSIHEYTSENESLRSHVQRLSQTVRVLEDQLWDLQHPHAQAVLDETLNSWDRQKDLEDMTGDWE